MVTMLPYDEAELCDDTIQLRVPKSWKPTLRAIAAARRKRFSDVVRLALWRDIQRFAEEAKRKRGEK